MCRRNCNFSIGGKLSSADDLTLPLLFQRMRTRSAQNGMNVIDRVEGRQ